MSKRKISLVNVSEIIKLRKTGHSIPEISKLLSIPKATVTRYVKDVSIDEDYIFLWREKRGGSKKIKELKIGKALNEARSIVSNLTLKEKMIFMSALYWGEGSKGDFGLSNTDPTLIKIFVNGLRSVFNITDDRLRVSIRIYEDLDKDKCLQFWAEIVNIPKDNFVNVNILPGKRHGKLKYGMCRVRVARGAELLKKIKAIYEVVANGFVPIA